MGIARKRNSIQVTRSGWIGSQAKAPMATAVDASHVTMLGVPRFQLRVCKAG